MQAVSQTQAIGRAVLKQAISYNKDGVEILIAGNTEILVDIEKEIALIGDDHVHVTSDEYTMI